MSLNVKKQQKQYKEHSDNTNSSSLTSAIDLARVQSSRTEAAEADDLDRTLSSEIDAQLSLLAANGLLSPASAGNRGLVSPATTNRSRAESSLDSAINIGRKTNLTGRRGRLTSGVTLTSKAASVNLKV